LFAQERPHLGPLNPNPYDLAHTSTSNASSQFRITLDTNQYSVPAAAAVLEDPPLTCRSESDPFCTAGTGGQAKFQLCRWLLFTFTRLTSVRG